jgi:K+-sensing histidine kinase KdpD
VDPGNAEKSRDLGSDAPNALTVIERNARAQSQIIQDLLDMSSIISGKVRLDVQRLDLASVIAATIESIRPAAEAKGIRLQIIVDPMAGPVRGDPNRLQQILWNLLANAVKFQTPKDGRIFITLARVNSHLEWEIADNGEGIEPHFCRTYSTAFGRPMRRALAAMVDWAWDFPSSSNWSNFMVAASAQKSGGRGLGSTFSNRASVDGHF